MTSALFASVTFIFLAFLAPQSLCDEERPIVKVTGGSVEGSIEKGPYGKPYYAFRGIPYAGAPVGEHRFKPPRPVEPWTEVRDGSVKAEYCAQSARGWTRGVEDCLTVNVYARKRPEKSSKGVPVLVWLHGGSFVTGGAEDYEPTFMMKNEIIIVVPQYRLGLLGFLYAGAAAPGNYGLLDQLAALKWVKENIAQFGGDPKKVTLAGDDAGGASALYHLAAPRSKGLFRSVVSISGTPLNPWARHIIDRKTAYIVSYRTGCSRNSGDALVGCLRNMPFEKLMNFQPLVFNQYQKVPDFMFINSNNAAPVIQSVKHGSEEDIFITESPLIVFAQGRMPKIPVLLVTAEHEGSYIVDNLVDDWVNGIHGEEAPDDDKEMIKLMIEYMGVVDKDGSKVEALWQEYLPEMQGKPYSEKRDGIARMLGDALHNAGMLFTAKYLSDKVPTRILNVHYPDGPSYPIYNTTDLSISDDLYSGHLDALNMFLPNPTHYRPFSNVVDKRVGSIVSEILTYVMKNKWSEDVEEIFRFFTPEGREMVSIQPSSMAEPDTFMTDGRAKMAEMIFSDHFSQELSKLKRLVPRDEL